MKETTHHVYALAFQEEAVLFVSIALSSLKGAASNSIVPADDWGISILA